MLWHAAENIGICCRLTGYTVNLPRPAILRLAFQFCHVPKPLLLQYGYGEFRD